MPRRPTFFHSRNCEAVTPAEIDIDSDDEVDQEEWAVRCLGSGQSLPTFVPHISTASGREATHGASLQMLLTRLFADCCCIPLHCYSIVGSLMTVFKARKWSSYLPYMRTSHNC